MLEVEEERLKDLSNDYGVDIEEIRNQACLLQKCTLIHEESVFDNILECIVSMTSSISKIIEKKSGEYKEHAKRAILIESIKNTLNNYEPKLIIREVEMMLNKGKEKRK